MADPHGRKPTTPKYTLYYTTRDKTPKRPKDITKKAASLVRTLNKCDETSGYQKLFPIDIGYAYALATSDPT